MTASFSTYDGQMGRATYIASKAGFVGLTLTAAQDLAEHKRPASAASVVPRTSRNSLHLSSKDPMLTGAVGRVSGACGCPQGEPRCGDARPGRDGEM
jgi:NAD(P)-dependent dehydrogenase (short-subunit alcohol dehydrogenase family)